MKLEMDESVQSRVKAHMANADDQLLLDLDDGVGRYSSVGNCSLDTSFQLLVVDSAGLDPVYNQAIDSPMGSILIKDYTATYLDEHPRLTLNKYGLIKLSADAGTIDENVAVIDHPEVVAAAQGSAHDC